MTDMEYRQRKREIFEDDELTIGDFKIGKIIGKGSYANVKIARNRLNSKKCALKCYIKKKLQTIKR